MSVVSSKKASEPPGRQIDERHVDGSHVDGSCSDSGELVEVQWQVAATDNCPNDDDISKWVSAASQHSKAGVTIRVVSAEEIQTYNNQWRGKDKATNVLSFPADFPDEANIDYLGDILICAEVLQNESQLQNKPLHDHWAHIVVHGVLHLQGHDHEDDSQAQLMEDRERQILAKLGIADPYM